MSVVGYTTSNPMVGVVLVTWASLANGDSGTPFTAPHFSDKSVQVEGTFGAGGTLLLEGSNNGGVNYRSLNDPQGNALSVTAAKIEQVLENVLEYRPRVSAGDGTTALTTVLLLTTVARR